MNIKLGKASAAAAKDLPPYIYFGEHTSNPKITGHWIDHELIDEDIIAGIITPVGENEWPSDGDHKYVISFTDKGNVTLYNRDHTILWSS